MRPHILLLFPGGIIADQVQLPLDSLSSDTRIEAVDRVPERAGTAATNALPQDANTLDDMIHDTSADIADFTDHGMWKKQLAWLHDMKNDIVWAQDMDWMQNLAWLKGMADMVQSHTLDDSQLKILLDDAGAWAKEHPGTIVVVGLGFLVVLAPGLVTGPILAIIGFGEEGVGAGTFAAAIHSAIGNVMTPSMFAALQSAAMGGYGLAVVNGIAQMIGAGASAAALWEAIRGAKDPFQSAANSIQGSLGKWIPLHLLENLEFAEAGGYGLAAANGIIQKIDAEASVFALWEAITGQQDEGRIGGEKQ